MFFYQKIDWTDFSLWGAGILLILLLVAAISDFKTQKISNIISYTGIIFFIILCFLNIESFWQNLTVFIIVFLFFGTLFALKWMGGGDVKMFLLLSVAIPVQFLLSCFLWVFVFGGVFGLFCLFKKKKSIPYAVPIFCGTLFYFLMSAL
ncbi:MAG: prepilin peptidase [Candidatus Peregrinibacteria bacterium]|nr:prepilin peptidase [Candidatus Peregrinibacteria bacterium]